MLKNVNNNLIDYKILVIFEIEILDFFFEKYLLLFMIIMIDVILGLNFFNIKKDYVVKIFVLFILYNFYYIEDCWYLEV